MSTRPGRAPGARPRALPVVELAAAPLQRSRQPAPAARGDRRARSRRTPTTMPSSTRRSPISRRPTRATPSSRTGWSITGACAGSCRSASRRRRGRSSATRSSASIGCRSSCGCRTSRRCAADTRVRIAIGRIDLVAATLECRYAGEDESDERPVDGPRPSMRVAGSRARAMASLRAVDVRANCVAVGREPRRGDPKCARAAIDCALSRACRRLPSRNRHRAAPSPDRRPRQEGGDAGYCSSVAACPREALASVAHAASALFELPARCRLPASARCRSDSAPRRFHRLRARRLDPRSRGAARDPVPRVRSRHA